MYISRRKFIKNSTGGAIAVGIGSGLAVSVLQSCATGKKVVASAVMTGFQQQPLPYKYDALENVIDAMTMEIHYSKHAAAYAKNMNDAINELKLDINRDKLLTVENLLATISHYNAKLRNNAGGHYNHELFWQCMRPKQADNKPTGKLAAAIDKTFTSFDAFKKKFAAAGMTRFGSGWAWLLVKDGKLEISSTPNQDNPLMDVSEIKGFPILALDVWEHAYYLKYQNKRADYIDNWWQVVNWDYISKRYEWV